MCCKKTSIDKYGLPELSLMGITKTGTPTSYHHDGGGEYSHRKLYTGYTSRVRLGSENFVALANDDVRF
jgi:hypothetical protein